MFDFSDILYGRSDYPDWHDCRSLRFPNFFGSEVFALSNVDSFEFKDFNGPTRWDHCVGRSKASPCDAPRVAAYRKEKRSILFLLVCSTMSVHPRSHTRLNTYSTTSITKRKASDCFPRGAEGDSFQNVRSLHPNSHDSGVPAKHYLEAQKFPSTLTK